MTLNFDEARRYIDQKTNLFALFYFLVFLFPACEKARPQKVELPKTTDIQKVELPEGVDIYSESTILEGTEHRV
jgi:hypothetical protein